MIVAYKIDRLTRSLADFSRIVDVLDTHGASFISITQALQLVSACFQAIIAIYHELLLIITRIFCCPLPPGVLLNGSFAEILHGQAMAWRPVSKLKNREKQGHVRIP